MRLTGNMATPIALELFFGTAVALSLAPTSTDASNTTGGSSTQIPSYVALCPSNHDCDKLGGDCIDCDFPTNCTYGALIDVKCTVKSEISCLGNRNITRASVPCRYCYQSPPESYVCETQRSCNSVGTPRARSYVTKCSMSSQALCAGKRTFKKKLMCSWKGQVSWSTALILSVTLGGFGVDRFYLGLWKEGIGKLFSFGGLGVWTIVDVVLIATGYVGPADGSHYA